MLKLLINPVIHASCSAFIILDRMLMKSGRNCRFRKQITGACSMHFAVYWLMQPLHCPNCQQSLAGQVNYCTQCGQTTHLHRITVGYLFHELFHAVTHTDKGLLYLVKELTIRPAKMASEYVSGARKKYFNPFTFLILCIAAIVLINNLVKPYDLPKTDPKVLAQIKDPATRQMYVRYITRSNQAMELMNKHSNLIYMTAIPFYAFIIWLFFRKRGRNFAEMTAALVFFTAYISLMYSVIFTPLQAYFKGTKWFGYLFMASILVYSLYYAWGLKGFLRFKSRLAFVKVLLVTLVTFFLWTLLTAVGMLVYVYGDQTLKITSALLKKL